MAVNPSTLYPGRIDTSVPAEYPYGRFRNQSAPGANDGTPSDEGWGNDMNGFFQALMDAAGIVPSGNPEEVGGSQLLDSLAVLFAAINDGRFPTTDQKAAMDNAAVPDAGNPFATSNEVINLPTSDEKNALAGTDGTPSAANPYVTDSDLRLGTSILHVRDEKTSGTNGQSFGVDPSGIFTRDLQTVKENTISGASLSSNQITLPAGTFRVTAFAIVVPNATKTFHQISLQNITDAFLIVEGSSEVTAGSNNDDSSTKSDIVGFKFTLNASKVLELQHYVREAVDIGGDPIGGLAVSSGNKEVYADIFIEQIG